MNELTLNPLFRSHMVLQADKPVRVFGTGNGTVTVTLGNITVTAVASSTGWLAELPAMPYGGPYTISISLGGHIITLEDVWVGEVIVLAGQSNLQFKLNTSTTPPEKWQDISRLRLFSSPRLEEGEPFKPEDGWVVCTKQNAGDWPALGYLVGELIEAKKDVAVGIITCYQGASVIETWVPEGLFAAGGISLTDEDKSYSHRCPQYQVWNNDGTLYHYVVEKLLPYSVGHVIWYQGESDVSPGESPVYARELCMLIDCWREVFLDATLPFVVVQLADLDSNTGEFLEAWRLLQQEQLDVQHMRDAVTTVICRDVCESYDIHPPRKALLAKRIASVILGQPIPFEPDEMLG
ncbi:MAG: hypothetical protein IJ518_02380 [Clostridia bacterium]|nr:hypothetical protein [Clostridia bacterium]